MSLWFWTSGDPTNWNRVQILDEDGVVKRELGTLAKRSEDILGERMVEEGHRGRGFVADGICRFKNGFLYIGDRSYALNSRGEVIFTHFGARWEPPIRKEKFSLLPPEKKKKKRKSLLRRIFNF
jgi:hypothetical protein